MQTPTPLSAQETSLPPSSQPDSLSLENQLKALNLTQTEYDLIIQGLGRAPNFNELSMFSVLWSEHCCYKHSRHLLKTLPTEGPQILQGPGENAGVIDAGGGIAVAFKIESHNHPTAVEPFQGAATGVGGILRDIFTMNARPIANLNALRFGPISNHGKQNNNIPKETIAHNRFLLKHAVEGIAHYGNCVGVPTIAGEMVTEASFSGNPLVNAMAIGTLCGDTIMESGAQGVGNPVIYMGAKTGKDGMGGAAFASKELDEQSHEDRPAVQVGDPFTEKLLIEACLEVFKTGYIVAAQDMGAAGLTCSGAEMSAKGNMGMIIDLDKVPAREPNMLPHEYLLSESQERMLMVVEKGRESDVIAIFDKWGLPATVVGEVIEENELRFLHQGNVVASVPPKLLADDAPLFPGPMNPPEPQTLRQQREQPLSHPDLNWNEVPQTLEQLFESPNIQRAVPVFHQYDRHVQGSTLSASEGHGAGVIQLKKEDGSFSGKALAASVDGNSRYVALNPYEGGKGIVAEAARNVVCQGAKPLAVTNNLNFGDPEKETVYYHLHDSIRGMKDACLALDTPVTGGNVSLYNEHGGSPILPSPVIGMVGITDNLQTVKPSSVNKIGNVLILLGEFNPSLGGSEYQSIQWGELNGEPPAVDLEKEARINQFLLGHMPHKPLEMAQDISLGGLLVTLTKTLFPKELQSLNNTPKPKVGATLDITPLLDKTNRLDTALFGETHGTYLVSIDAAIEERFLGLAQDAGLKALKLGTITDTKTLQLTAVNQPELNIDLAPLCKQWHEGFSHALNG